MKIQSSRTFSYLDSLPRVHSHLTGSIKVSSSNNQQNQSNSSGSSGGGGNAKYLRYVRSKLSKTRLNSVLSLAGGSSSKQDQAPPGHSVGAELPPLSGGGLSEIQLSAESSAMFVSQQHQQYQQRLDSDGTSQQFKAELVGAERQHHFGTSNLEVSGHGERQQLLNQLPPSGTAFVVSQQRRPLQQQASIKKSNFFQGFRYTLRGRRGSKQQATFDQSDNLETEPQQQQMSISSSRKFKHKLLSSSQAIDANSSQESTPSASPGTAISTSSSSTSPFARAFHASSKKLSKSQANTISMASAISSTGLGGSGGGSSGGGDDFSGEFQAVESSGGFFASGRMVSASQSSSRFVSMSNSETSSQQVTSSSSSSASSKATTFSASSTSKK